MKKRIEIIPIALRKAMRRGISKEIIEEAIDLPDQILQGYGGRRVAHRKYVLHGKAGLLRVVFEDKAESCEVVTAYWTSQIDRYWKEETNENRI